LITSVQFRVEAEGTLSGVRIVKSSGSREFDDAVRTAIRRVSGSIGPRPDGKSEVVELDFRAKEDGD
jgi:TonB family protein